MKLNINELEVLIEGLIMLNNTDSFVFSTYGINDKEFLDKLIKEVDNRKTEYIL